MCSYLSAVCREHRPARDSVQVRLAGGTPVAPCCLGRGGPPAAEDSATTTNWLGRGPPDSRVLHSGAADSELIEPNTAATRVQLRAEIPVRLLLGIMPSIAQKLPVFERPVFCGIAVDLVLTIPPVVTSETRSRTRSQRLNLQSIATLKVARSRKIALPSEAVSSIPKCAVAQAVVSRQLCDPRSKGASSRTLRA
jgi:hypothetical protein